jgi:hypothetical protein
MAFSKAGRELAHWHLNYETVALPPRSRVVKPKPLAPPPERNTASPR